MGSVLDRSTTPKLNIFSKAGTNFRLEEGDEPDAIIEKKRVVRYLKNRTNKLLNLFTKLSLFSCIGPFIGNERRCQYLLEILCIDSKTFRTSNAKALKEVFRLSKWRNYNIDLAHLLIKHEMEPFPTYIDKDYSLTLDFKHNYSTCMMFMDQAKDYQFGEIHKVVLLSMCEIATQDKDIVKRFFSFTAPRSLDILILDNGVPELCESIKWDLGTLMLNTKHQIYMAYFQLDEQDLTIVMEKSRNAEILTLYRCQVKTIYDSFILDSEVEYKQTSLDLYGTCRMLDNEYLSLPKSHKFFSKIGPLMKKLKRIHVDYLQVPSHLFREVLESCDIEAEVVYDCTRPTLPQ